MVGCDKTVQNKKGFLKAYADTGTIGRACELVGTSRTQYYRWLESDPDFVHGCKLATAAFGEKLENEALRRAHDGWDEPVFFRGEMQGHVHKYSDTLLIFLMKGNMPDKYHDRHEVGGRGGGPLEITVRWDGNGNVPGSTH